MLNQPEFTAILADPGKRIEGDLAWTPNPQHAGAVGFRAEVLSASGYPLFVAGWYRPQHFSLAYTLVHRPAGRIYALNFGHPHTNEPTGERFGNKHKHYWTEQHDSQLAYYPADITAPWHRPVAVWRQFCAEASIAHHGILYPHPPG